MNLRTYHAPSIAEALGQIKRELGPNAVILHTRTYKKGGWFGVGGHRAVEITASNSVNVVSPLARKGKAPTESPANPIGRSRQPGSQSAVAGRSDQRESRDGLFGRAARVQDHLTLDGSNPLRVSSDVASSQVEFAARDVARAVAAAATTEAMDPALVREELASIKRLVGQVLRSGGERSAPALPAALASMYLRLIEAEVASEIADMVVSEVRDELSIAELDDVALVRDRVLWRIERFIAVAEDAPTSGRMPDGRPLTIALVGPTGVGKTTTLAKLAATYKLRHGRRVGLVTCDTYRIAAVEQLRTYANIIGLRLNVALTPGEMAGSCSELSDCDVILIDTAGRSQHDDDRLKELSALLAAANPHETHLVLSGASSESVLTRAAERFTLANPNRMILSKLDEAVSFGVLVNVAHRIGTSLSYITTGQEVPDHIEPGRSDRLARLVLDGGGVR